MTTVYLFHPWIEASETGDSVLSVFGAWWDGDADPPAEEPEGLLTSGSLIRGGMLLRGRLVG